MKASSQGKKLKLLFLTAAAPFAVLDHFTGIAYFRFIAGYQAVSRCQFPARLGLIDRNRAVFGRTPFTVFLVPTGIHGGKLLHSGNIEPFVIQQVFNELEPFEIIIRIPALIALPVRKDQSISFPYPESLRMYAD
jgi:hypothetical protein